MNFKYAYIWAASQANIIVSVDKNIFNNNNSKTQIANYIRSTELFKNKKDNHKKCSIIFFCQDNDIVGAIDGTDEEQLKIIQNLINKNSLNIPSEHWFSHTL